MEERYFMQMEMTRKQGAGIPISDKRDFETKSYQKTKWALYNDKGINRRKGYNIC